ncbi:MAG: sulfatase-like hydrolase/transferase, partial [Flammeovirgaceae bacterium]|nr:sulfatase-like hydrolase/transferase [Flammeovirgaceae bacterium]
TIAEVFKGAGYATGCFGKWHNGAHFPNSPQGQGFDEFTGFTAGHLNNYFDSNIEKNGENFKASGYITDFLANEAMGFIENNKDKPFFCYIPFNAPHTPYQVPDKYYDKYYNKLGIEDDTKLRARSTIYGMVENIDDNVGRILNKLHELHLSENTIVLFITDNGPNGKRFNDNMRGIKGWVHEGGIRVPCFIKWPGKLPQNKKIDQITAHIDILPTLVELAGIKQPHTLPWDGKSLVKLIIKDDQTPYVNRALFTHQRRGSSEFVPIPGTMRTNQFRMVVYDNKQPMLFDMQKDPEEKNNLATEMPDLVNKMYVDYQNWFKDVTSEGLGFPPIPVGYSEAPRVELPAHEGFKTEGIEYKGSPQGWANDWFCSWDNQKDSVYWEIDVVEKSTFKITLKYTCPEKNLGSTVQVKSNSQKVSGKVEKAFDPEVIPSPDRVKRKEAYEKEWASMDLGNLELDKGKTKIVVKASDIPNLEAFDLKAVILEKVVIN